MVSGNMKALVYDEVSCTPSSIEDADAPFHAVI
jgi:hypothetical protein